MDPSLAGGAIDMVPRVASRLVARWTVVALNSGYDSRIDDNICAFVAWPETLSIFSISVQYLVFLCEVVVGLIWY